MRENQARKAADILSALMDRVGASEGSAYVGLFSSWREIVGDRIADHSEPVDVRGTALVVQADHPGWVQMIMMNRRSIIKKVSSRYPSISITGLHVRVRGTPDHGHPGGDVASLRAEKAPVDSDPEQEAPASPEVMRKEVPATEAESLSNIVDEELRETLLRLRDSLKDKE